MTDDAQRPERPYLANYVIGLMLVMGFSMIFNALSTVLYPIYYSNVQYAGNMYVLSLIAMASYQLFLTVMMYIGSGIGYRLTKMSMIMMITLMGTGLALGGNLGFDIWIQVVLAIVVLTMMHLPSISSYYDNLSLGRMPRILAE